MAGIGEIIDGKYEVLREIGRGGMSVVYLAMDKRLNKQWAVKEFRKDKNDESKKMALNALIAEANLMKKLDHPTLPRIVDIIENNQTVYVVMDYIEGESLNKVLDAYGAQPQEAVIEWAKQLSEVLDYLHTRTPPIIYRDMKPANIMLKPDGTVRLIDFGIAREYKEGKTEDTTNIGTRGYAAPEQFGDKGQTDARTDIYSLGVTLYHLVTGKNPAEPPYELYPIRHWNPSLSSGLEWLIQKCTQLNPKDRFQSCAEVTYVLENLDKFEGAYKRSRQHKIQGFFASVSLTVVFALLGGLSLLGMSSQAESKYSEAVANQDYAQAISIDQKKSEAYLSLVDVYKNEYENSGKTFSDLSEFTEAFSDDNLAALKQADIKSYIRVTYNVGKIIYSSYRDDSNDGKFAKDKAAKYFLMALSANNSLSEKELNSVDENRCKAFFMLSFLSKMRASIKNGESFELSSGAVDIKYFYSDTNTVNDGYKSFSEYFGINVDSGSIKDPRKESWNIIRAVVKEFLNDSTETSDAILQEVETQIAYMLQSNTKNFVNACDDKADFTKLCSDLKTIIDKTDFIESDDKSAEEIKSDILKDVDMALANYSALIKASGSAGD